LRVGSVILHGGTEDFVENSHRWLSLCLNAGGSPPVQRTVGDASSSASAWANSGAQELFYHLWAAYPNGACPVSGGPTRGTSAAADWAAHKTIGLPDLRDRFPLGHGYEKSVGDSDGRDDDGSRHAADPSTALASATGGAALAHVGYDEDHSLSIPQLEQGASASEEVDKNLDGTTVNVAAHPHGHVGMSALIQNHGGTLFTHQHGMDGPVSHLALGFFILAAKS
jgi:hypothetical protein